MKKIFKNLAFALVGVTALAALASCGGHTHSYKWESDATKHRQVCEECKEETPYEAHKWGEWEVVKEATEDAAGLRKHVCSECEYVGEEAIPEKAPATGVATAETAVYAQVPADWEAVNIYYWNSLEGDANTLDPELATVWPGAEMVEVNADQHIWGFKVPAGVNSVIFNNGSSQTVDIAFALSRNLYVLGEEANADGKFEVTYRKYTPAATDPELPGAVVTKVEKITLYAQVPASWAAVKLHFWGLQETTWPGKDMVLADETNNIYKYDDFVTSSGFIINNNDGVQTANLALFEDKDINIIIVEEDGSVSYGKYENGVITPVEVEIDKTITELYVIGSMNTWTKNEDFKMTIADDTATIEIILLENAEFKLYDGDWAHDWATFGYVDTLSEAFADKDGNIKVVTAGTYVITVSGLNTDPVLTITLKA